MRLWPHFGPCVLHDPDNNDDKGSGGEPSTPPDDKGGTPEGDAATLDSSSDEAAINADLERYAEDRLKKTEGEPPLEDKKEDPIEEEPVEGEEGKEGEAKDEDEDQPEDPDAEVPFSKHPRWQEVLKQRNELTRKVETLAPLAETGQMLQEFCSANNVTNEDLVEALDLVALSKKDPKTFRDRMAKYVESLDIVSGTALPADLKKKVEDGIMTAEDAKELAKYRIETEQARTAQQRQAQRQQQEVQQRQQALNAGMEKALNDWEASRLKSDPGLAKRQRRVMDRMKSIWIEQPPTSVAEAVAIAERADKEVRSEIAKERPVKPEKKVLKSGGSSPNVDDGGNLDSMDDLGKLVEARAARFR